MSYKQKAGSPFQRNFGSKAPLKRHEEGHEQTNSEFYQMQRLIADPNAINFGNKGLKRGETAKPRTYMELQGDGTYKVMKNTGIRNRRKGSTSTAGDAFSSDQLKNTFVTDKQKEEQEFNQARLEHNRRQDEKQKEYNKLQKKKYKKMKKYEKAYYDEQDEEGNYLNREAYTRQAYS